MLEPLRRLGDHLPSPASDAEPNNPAKHSVTDPDGAAADANGAAESNCAADPDSSASHSAAYARADRDDMRPEGQ